MEQGKEQGKGFRKESRQQEEEQEVQQEEQLGAGSGDGNHWVARKDSYAVSSCPAPMSMPLQRRKTR